MQSRGRGGFWQFAGAGAGTTFFRINAVGVGGPAEAARGDAGDTERDPMFLAEFIGAVVEKTDERPVDVAEAEKAEIEGADGVFPAQGLKPRRFPGVNAALKGRSSTELRISGCESPRFGSGPLLRSLTRTEAR
jgi:hypothetical protein